MILFIRTGNVTIIVGNQAPVTMSFIEEIVGYPTSIAHLDYQVVEPGRILIGSSDQKS